MLEDLYERLKCASQATIPTIKVEEVLSKTMVVERTADG